MRITRLPPQPPAASAVTIGNFDGLHLGHQQIIRRLIDHARQRNLVSVVLLFEPQPREFIDLATAPVRLSSLTDKACRLAAMGVDWLVVLPFNRALQALSAAEFVAQVLQHKLNTHWLQVGDDFRFGADRQGNAEFLGRYPFTVVDLPSQARAGKRVSSTRIREHLQANRLAQAAELLGSRYTLHGRVVYGRALGRTLGVPTANILLPHKKLPTQGVFAVRARVRGQWLNGVANLGAKPTVGDPRYWLETHFLNFSGNLYGERLGIELHKRLRDIVTFDNLNQLKAQLKLDVEAAQAFFVSEP